MPIGLVFSAAMCASAALKSSVPSPGHRCSSLPLPESPPWLSCTCSSSRRSGTEENASNARSTLVLAGALLVAGVPSARCAWPRSRQNPTDEKWPTFTISTRCSGVATAFVRFSSSSFTPSGPANAFRCSIAVSESSSARVPAVVLAAEVQHAGLDGNLLGGFERALHLVHRRDTRGLLHVDEVQRGGGVAAPDALVVRIEEWHVHRRRDGVGLEPRGYVAYGGAVGVVEVMARGEEFDGLSAGRAQRV